MTDVSSQLVLTLALVSGVVSWVTKRIAASASGRERAVANVVEQTVAIGRFPAKDSETTT